MVVYVREAGRERLKASRLVALLSSEVILSKNVVAGLIGQRSVVIGPANRFFSTRSRAGRQGEPEGVEVSQNDKDRTSREEGCRLKRKKKRRRRRRREEGGEDRILRRRGCW